MLNLNQKYTVGLIIGLCTAIFAMDLNIPLGVADGVLYFIPVYVASRLPLTKASLYTASVSSLLLIIAPFYSPTGSELWLALDNRLLSLVVIWATVWFVIDRKRGEAELFEMNLALSNAMPGISRLDTDGHYLYVNEAYAAMLGYTPDELLGSSWEPTVHVEDRSIAMMAVQKATEEGKGEFEARAIRKDGSEFYKQLLMIRITDKDGQVTGHHCFMKDITERKKAEDNLQKYKHIVSNSTDLLALIDSNYIYQAVNDTYLDYFEKSQEEVIGHHVKDILGQEVFEQQVKPNMDRCLSGQKVSYQLRIDSPEKGIRYMDACYTPSHESDGLVTSLIITVRDITEHKQAEMTLIASEKKFRSLLEADPDGMVIVNAKGEILIVNQQLQLMTGYIADELIGQPVEMLIPERFNTHKQYRDNYFSNVRSRMMGEGMELFLQQKDGSDFSVEISLSPLETADGLIISVAIRDISERKNAEKEIEEAYQNQRKLVARLDHIREEERTSISRELHDEFGNAFTLQNLDLAWIKKKLSNNDEEIESKIDSMILNNRKSIEQVRTISSNLRPTILDDLGLDAAIEWYCREINKSAEFSYKVLGHLPHDLQGNVKTSLFRIFQEALTNIIRHADADKVRIELNNADNHIYMNISDNGIGIDESITTHPDTLGLLGMIERAKQYGGYVEIKNHDEGGTQLTVCIPMDDIIHRR